jgi:hypothetical protein
MVIHSFQTGIHSFCFTFYVHYISALTFTYKGVKCRMLQIMSSLCPMNQCNSQCRRRNTHGAIILPLFSNAIEDNLCIYPTIFGSVQLFIARTTESETGMLECDEIWLSTHSRRVYTVNRFTFLNLYKQM